jgi:pimeloyl-ACP methyl ester carboxylesterase
MRTPLRPFFTTVLSDIRDVCTAWALEPVDASVLEPVKSDTPALLMAGQFDITTPPPLAMEVQHNLRNSFLFAFPATGHVVLGECALNMLGAFLEDPSTKPDDTCVKELKLSFVTP